MLLKTFADFRSQFSAKRMPDAERGLLGERLRKNQNRKQREHELKAAYKNASRDYPTSGWSLTKSMVSGIGVDEAFWVYYYWLHANHPDLDILAKLDHSLKRCTTATEPELTQSPVPTPPISDISEFFNTERYDNDLHYTSQIIDVLGRKTEQQTLRNFLADDRMFCWLQLAGVGGQGKSRLAFELVQAAGAENWDAGFLTEQGLHKFKDRWTEWQPAKPTLIVIDYVMGRESIVGHIFSSLIQRNQAFAKPVRLLLIERQRFDRGALERPKMNANQQSVDFPPAYSGKAQWFLDLFAASLSVSALSPDNRQIADARFGDGVIELKRLQPDELFSIVRQIVLQHDKSIALPEDQIKVVLARIDQSGRPLFAYLLGHGLAARQLQPDWTRDDLLTSYLEREQKTRWEKVFGTNGRTSPSLDDGTPSIQIARLATIIGGYDNFAAKDILRKIGWTEPDITTLKEASVLVDGAVGNGGPFAGYIPPFQPDLLGEWFVLWAFTSGTTDTTHLLETAWALDMLKTSAFLQRCAQDFPRQPQVNKLFDVVPSDGIAHMLWVITCVRRTENLLQLADAATERMQAMFREFRSRLPKNSKPDQ